MMIGKAYQRLIIPAYESVIKGRKTFRHWRDLEQSQWLSADELSALQRERLQTLLAYCQQHSTWHRDRWAELGLSASDVGSLDDLQKFPITTREMMRDRSDAIRSDDDSLRYVSKATGGSSGTPLRFVIEHDAVDRRVAAAFRGYSWAGGQPGTRQSHLWGTDLGNVPRWKRWKTRMHLRGLYRHDLLNSFDLSIANASSYVNRINRYQPKVIVAYTSPLYSLARSILDQGLRVHRPESIIVGAEKLHRFQRDVIEQAFGAPVFETYGSREFTLIGAECEEHSGLHLSSENLVVEVTKDDGSPADPGQEGHVVITDLFNTAMPFVRYAIGDRAVAGFQQCRCGRGLPLLREVVGRQLDMVLLPDGRTLPGEFFPHLVKDYSSIQQFQVVQTQPDLIDVKLVVDSRWSQEESDSLRDKIQSQLRDASLLKFTLVEEIPLTAVGKQRVVVGFDSMPSNSISGAA